MFEWVSKPVATPNDLICIVPMGGNRCWEFTYHPWCPNWCDFVCECHGEWYKPPRP